MSEITDKKTQAKWDKAAPSFDFMAGLGAEKRWAEDKSELFSYMDGNILFLALGQVWILHTSRQVKRLRL